MPLDVSYFNKDDKSIKLATVESGDLFSIPLIPTYHCTFYLKPAGFEWVRHYFPDKSVYNYFYKFIQFVIHQSARQFPPINLKLKIKHFWQPFVIIIFAAATTTTARFNVFFSQQMGFDAKQSIFHVIRNFLNAIESSLFDKLHLSIWPKLREPIGNTRSMRYVVCPYKITLKFWRSVLKNSLKSLLCYLL